MKNLQIALLCCLLAGSSLLTAGPADSTKTGTLRKPYRASNTRQNDLLHTRLDVSFDWNKSQMSGKASITGKPYFRPTSQLYLNARGMDIQSVEVYDLSSKTSSNLTPSNPELPPGKKLSATYKYEHDSLKINLGKEFASDEKYLVKVNYLAKPDELAKGGSQAITEDKGLYFINPKGEDKRKMPQIWTQGETQSNSVWFPTIDSPNEKMTTEIYMTVDSKYTTLSNGILSESKTNANGTRTDHWKMDLPHSPYLVMMAVGEFKKVTDAPWNGKEISYYVEKEYEPYAKAIFGNTKEMIDFFSKALGTPYPWPKYSQIVVRDYVSGAMENTSATLHGDFIMYQTEREMLDGKKGEDVISHELFHQWFGDLATAESWSNLTLNESFATYGEYLWQEYKNGRDAADAHSYHSRVGYYNAATQKQVNLVRFDYDKQEDMFDAWSYNKGGQVLHMLRKYVGDKVFFASLKLYLERNRFKSAEVHDLRLAFEEVSGEDLNWFFNEWYYAKGHPLLDIEKNYDAFAKIIRLKVKQTQDLDEWPLYTLPVDIDIYAGGKKQRQRIVIDRREQEFIFKSDLQPDLVNFDAERQLLAIKNYSKTNEEMIFMYKNAGLFSDRNEALGVLRNKIEEADVYAFFKYALENDPWYELRISALQALNKVALKKEDELTPLVSKMAKSDQNTNVRAEAITFLAKNYKRTELTEIYKVASNEQSYAVLSAALKALADSDPGFALEKAKTLETEKNESLFDAIATVYTKAGDENNNSYFIRKKEDFSGYGYIGYMYAYGEFLKTRKEAKTFMEALTIFADILKQNNPYIQEEGKRILQDYLLVTVKQRQEDLKKGNGSADNLKEWEVVQAKIEALSKQV